MQPPRTVATNRQASTGASPELAQIIAGSESPTPIHPDRENLRSGFRLDRLAYALTWKEISNGSVKDAYYNVGPDGIDGYFKDMAKEAGEQGLYTYSTSFCVVFAFMFFVMGDGRFYSRMSLLMLAVAAVCGAVGIWHSGARRAYQEAWEELEARGIMWHYENGNQFRYTLIRNDGSYSIDTKLHQERLREEVEGVRDRAKELQRINGKNRLGWIIGAAIFAILNLIISFFGLTLFWIEVTGLIGLFSVYLETQRELGKQIALKLEQDAYDRGCQFIPAPHVRDPMPAPVTKETVTAHSAHDNAGFVAPHEASAGLS